MIENLLRAEVMAARIEGICRADPALGSLWRAEGVVAEAVATVGLEGVRIEAWDFLPRIAFNGGVALEQGYAETMEVERALRALRILKAPGDPFRDPVGSLRRIESLGGSNSLSDPSDPFVDADGPVEERSPREPRIPDEEVAGLLAACHAADSPILAALRSASAYRLAVPGGEPVVERALFVMMEGALRRSSALGERQGRGATARVPPFAEWDDEPQLRGLSEGVSAEWIALPSVALVRGPLRLWNPGTAKGVSQLLESLVGSLSYELGRFIPLRGWMQAVGALAQGRTGRSRLLDAARLFVEYPVMTASDMARHLGITPRGATNLATELAGQGLLGEITHRRYARIWATPEIARLLETRAVRQRLRNVQERSDARLDTGAGEAGMAPAFADPGAVARGWDDRKTKSEARLERIFEELDEALARTDALLARG
jgi:hypothetical protein